MQRHSIDPREFVVRPHELWNHQTLALGTGSISTGNANVMTVGWGGFGTMWARPVAWIVVRPHRHTFGLMEAYPEFSLCAFGAAHAHALKLFGSRSGRDTDKIAKSGLHLLQGTCTDAPGFEEAELIMECRAIYHSTIDPAGFMDPLIEKNYPAHDYHHIWYGEILSIQGTDTYHAG